ncbi:MAG: hypothetical protein JSV42_08815 [Chloroflexota bacterium]|nr:MAG: hypothetical protein JSV42_08815 [Chloroflexota bacterium]
MAVSRPRIPIALPIIIIVLLILGFLAGPFIESRTTEQQLADNVLLNAIPFLLIFVAILLTYILLIVILGSMLNNNVPPRVYKIIESILIAGIVLGVVGMFQPWVFLAYKYGFVLLLASILLFIVWSHVSPRREAIQQEEGPGALSEAKSNNVESSSRV